MTSPLEPLKVTFEDSVPWWVKVFGSALLLILFTVLAGLFQFLFSQAHEQSHLLRELQAKVSASDASVSRFEKVLLTECIRLEKLQERVLQLEKTPALPKLPSDLLLSGPSKPNSIEVYLYSEDWCGPCRMLKARTLTNLHVKEAMRRLGVAGVRVFPAGGNVSSIPTCWLVKDGVRPFGVSELVGYATPDEFVRWLEVNVPKIP